MVKKKIYSEDHKLGAEVWNFILVRNVPSFLRWILQFFFLYHEVESKEIKSSKILAEKFSFWFKKGTLRDFCLTRRDVAKIEKVEEIPLQPI